MIAVIVTSPLLNLQLIRQGPIDMTTRTTPPPLPNSLNMTRAAQKITLGTTRIICPSCGRPLRAPEGLNIRAKASCPRCGHVFCIGETKSPAEPAAQIEPANLHVVGRCERPASLVPPPLPIQGARKADHTDRRLARSTEPVRRHSRLKPALLLLMPCLLIVLLVAFAARFTSKTAEEQSKLVADSDPLQSAIRSYYGTSGTIDVAKAKPYFVKAAESDDPLAKIYMAHLLDQGACQFSRDSARAQLLARDVIDEVANLARSGDRDAMFAYASSLETALGIERDQSAAVNWMRKAAEQGHARAQFNMYRLCSTGIGVTADSAEALKWLHSAVQQNDAHAIIRLGTLYLYGDQGFAKDLTRGLDLTRQAAEMGDWRAQCNLSYYYLSGYGVERNEVEATKWQRKAADQSWEAYGEIALNYYTLKNYAEAVKWSHKAIDAGIADGAFCLAICYQFGNGLAHDHVEAISWYKHAADKGHLDAQCNLGVIYRDGLFSEQDPAKAAQWFRKAAETGHAKSQLCLGVLYFAGNGVKQDHKQAISWVRKAAEQGFAGAQAGLGAAYDKGHGVEQDPVQAVKWYRLAAEQGYAAAQVSLGNCLASGDGVGKDDVEAVKWFRKAAEQGDATGQVYLGQSYEEGAGIPKDVAEAFKWYQKAAEQGEAVGLNQMGLCYERGVGVSKDATIAFRWFEKAAEKGDHHAQYNVGLSYQHGRGVSINLAAAAKWYGRAADQGNADAQTSLGVFYMLGDGVEKDTREALALWRKAAAQGSVAAKNNLALHETPRPRPVMARPAASSSTTPGFAGSPMPARSSSNNSGSYVDDYRRNAAQTMHTNRYTYGSNSTNGIR